MPQSESIQSRGSHHNLILLCSPGNFGMVELSPISLVLHALHMHATLFLMHVSTSENDFICRKQLFVTYTNEGVSPLCSHTITKTFIPWGFQCSNGHEAYKAISRVRQLEMMSYWHIRRAIPRGDRGGNERDHPLYEKMSNTKK
jgi:hypothetical protein